jgi:excisionase family DNA binding protein
MRSRQELKEEASVESNLSSIRVLRRSTEADESSDRLLTDRDVCSLTGLDRVTLYRLRNAGKIGFYKLGKVIRYSTEHIREFLAQHERQPRARRPRLSK